MRGAWGWDVWEREGGRRCVWEGLGEGEGDVCGEGGGDVCGRV